MALSIFIPTPWRGSWRDGVMKKAYKDQDEAKLEKLAKRLLATPPKPREESKVDKPKRGRAKKAATPSSRRDRAGE